MDKKKGKTKRSKIGKTALVAWIKCHYNRIHRYRQKGKRQERVPKDISKQMESIIKIVLP
jgi:hypothetical protein